MQTKIKRSSIIQTEEPLDAKRQAQKHIHENLALMLNIVRQLFRCCFWYENKADFLENSL